MATGRARLLAAVLRSVPAAPGLDAGVRATVAAVRLLLSAPPGARSLLADLVAGAPVGDPVAGRVGLALTLTEHKGNH